MKKKFTLVIVDNETGETLLNLDGQNYSIKLTTLSSGTVQAKVDASGVLNVQENIEPNSYDLDENDDFLDVPFQSKYEN